MARLLSLLVFELLSRGHPRQSENEVPFPSSLLFLLTYTHNHMCVPGMVVLLLMLSRCPVAVVMGGGAARLFVC